MARGVSGVVAREIRTLFSVGATGALTDAQLLERFLSRPREEAEAAFAALVARHGPMVLATCRRVLRDDHDAEDAFQATFLVLVRRAASVARRELLAGWLYGVAVRTARSVRARSVRRQAGERRAMDVARCESLKEEARGELDALLDEELGRLPEKYRLPVILCELEGLSRRAAAHRLGVPEGTVASRLARGRGLLRVQLERRGLAPAAVGALAAASRGATAAEVPAMLFEATVRIAAALRFGEVTSGMVSASVSSIVEGGMKRMLLAKLKITTLALLSVSGIAAAVAVARQDPDSAGADHHLPGVSYPQDNRQAAAIDALPRSAANSSPGSVIRVKEVLQSAISHTGWHRRFSMKVRSQQDGPRRVVTEAIIRKDGAKVDFQSTAVLVGQPADYPGNTTDRGIDDGKSWIARTTSIGHKKLSGGLSVVAREQHVARAFTAWTYGFALDGHLFGNQRKRLVEILSAAPQLVAAEEIIDGIRCLRVSANTEYGKITVWLDPASNYCLRKSTMLKGRNNVYNDSRVGEHADTVGIESYQATVSNIKYTRVGQYPVPSGGTVTFTQTPNGQPPERWTITYERSEIDLDPVFEGSDAFKMDFADGARLSDWDSDGRGSYFLWRGGAMVPQVEQR